MAWHRSFRSNLRGSAAQKKNAAHPFGCAAARPLLEGMGKLGCAIVDLDYLSPMSQGRERMGPHQVLLGNVNPVLVLRDSSAEGVTKAVAACHRETGPRFIMGAGCEVPRDTPEENLRAMCEYAHSHQP